MQISLQQLKTELALRFPKIWIKDGAEFDSCHAESLWTGEGSMIEFTDLLEGDAVAVPAFDMYPMFELMYEFGVYNDLAVFLRERGYYAEAYDGGTFFIWKA